MKKWQQLWKRYVLPYSFKLEECVGDFEQKKICVSSLQQDHFRGNLTNNSTINWMYGISFIYFWIIIIIILTLLVMQVVCRLGTHIVPFHYLNPENSSSCSNGNGDNSHNNNNDSGNSNGTHNNHMWFFLLYLSIRAATADDNSISQHTHIRTHDARAGTSETTTSIRTQMQKVEWNNCGW